MRTDQTHTPDQTYHHMPINHIKQIQTIYQLIKIIAKAQ